MANRLLPAGRKALLRMRILGALAMGGLSLGLGSAAAQEADEGPKALLRFSGSEAMGARLIPDLSRGFLEAAGYAQTVARQGANPEDRILTALDSEDSEVAISVSGQNSAAALAALRAGEADFGMVSRPARTPGAARTPEGFETYVIGLDGVFVVVHPDNPLRSLSLAQIRDVFSGRISDWSRLDSGRRGPIRLLTPDQNSGAYELFRSLAMSGAAMSRSARRYETAADLAAAVSRDPEAIGFLGGTPGGAKPLAIAQDCGLLSAPDAYAVKSEEYPLARRLLLYRKPGEAPPAAEEFLSFALSEAARPALKRAGVTDLEIVPSIRGYGDEAVRRTLLLADPQEVGFADMQEFARFAASPEAQRLSVTFRFGFGGSDLDERARLDVKRLADWWRLLKQEQPRKRLAVFGFTDSLGPHDQNKGLARNRAKAVAEKLQAEGVKVDQLVGWGEIAPVACDWTAQGAVDESGQSRNRRVEIWIY